MLSNLIPLNLPQPTLRLAQKNGQPMVWDELRKKYLLLTPEEWVRQHFTHYLIHNLGVNKSAIALEGGFKLLGQLKRSDILVYKNAKARMLVECKAPQIKVGKDTLDQASRYNIHYQVDYIIITNGLEHFCLKLNRDKKMYEALKEIPHYEDL